MNAIHALLRVTRESQESSLLFSPTRHVYSLAAGRGLEPSHAAPRSQTSSLWSCEQYISDVEKLRHLQCFLEHLQLTNMQGSSKARRILLFPPRFLSWSVMLGQHQRETERESLLTGTREKLASPTQNS